MEIQGSVATCLRCDKIVSEGIIANFLESVPVNKFHKLVSTKIDENIDMIMASPFLTHGVGLVIFSA